jgi:fused signal recognition particle receptor
VNIRSIPRTAIKSYLRIVRWPLDRAIGMLPGSRESRTAAKVAVDRADAQARGVAGAVMRDKTLHEDAKRRGTAAQERERAIKLRGEAGRRTDQADTELEHRQEQVQRRRGQANQRATERRQRAEQEKEQKSRRAAEAEERRTQASREAEQRAEQRTEERAPEERLTALEMKAEAEQERAEALAETDEARRLSDAAARAKAERKDDAGEQ